MGLLLPLVLCVLVSCCGARSVPAQTLGPLRLLSRGCNDSDVLAVADFALQDINKDRKDGYVLSLNRVSDVWEYREASGPGSLYYLTLDVLETSCHVLTKKSWKDCGKRLLHESVYGQCKAMFYINKPRRVLYLLAYNCTLRPVSRRQMNTMCPDCPFPTKLSSSEALQAVTESLAKFNSESPSKQYSFVKITRFSQQWVSGPGYFVEYLIEESPCTKSQDSICTLQLSHSEPVGLCKGSLSQNFLQKFVSVDCDFFETQAPGPGEDHSAANQKPADLPSVEGHQQKGTNTPTETMPKGSVQNLPELDKEKPGDSQTKGSGEAFPVQLDLTTNPQGEEMDISFLFMGPVEEKLLVLPFPKGQQHSTECPGPAQEPNSLILPP
ncbi:PREDICTED: fetuin-B [Chrysochloris asiatica]|uniref:Fetuin-B n=1 Tax=Chrysochloris asiatica TaxID=185453 RepID=A0A9B0WVT6_CHRAS|nr:PREDICTED: fetuin-B [Chrysochloris asiatica]